MKLLACLLLFAVIAMSQGRKPHYDINDAPALFKKFVKDYGRHYKNEVDKEEHYLAFIKSLLVINEANAKSVGVDSATFDINYFADYTPEELKYTRGFIFPVHPK